MKKFVLGAAAALLAVSGLAASPAQAERRQNAMVSVSVVDSAGKSIELIALPEVDRQRVISLRNGIERWGNQQPQKVKVSIHCTHPPLRCTLTVEW